MSTFKGFLSLAILLLTFIFSACDPIDVDGDYEYYSLDGSGSVRSCRVFYPSSLENSSNTYPAVTLSGGMTNSKEDMYWMAEYLAGEVDVIVFAISASNNMAVNGYENAHEDGYSMMLAENNNDSSVLYNKIKKYGLMGYSMGGGAVLNVAKKLGGDIAAVIAMAPYNPDGNLNNVAAGCLIMVGSNDGVASPNWNAEPAYNDLPDSIDKCLLEIRSFSHLSWVRNSGSSGVTPKQLAGDWIDFIINGNTETMDSFTDPPDAVVLNWNNL